MNEKTWPYGSVWICIWFGGIGWTPLSIIDPDGKSGVMELQTLSEGGSCRRHRQNASLAITKPGWYGLVEDSSQDLPLESDFPSTVVDGVALGQTNGQLLWLKVSA